MSTWGPIRIELRQIAPDGSVALELAEAPREEVEARQADNGAARPETPLAEAVRADSDTLVAGSGEKPATLGSTAEVRSGYGRDQADVLA